MKEKRKIKTIDIIYIGLSAAIIAISAWISIPLFVPITLQTLSICLVSGLFGTKRGVLSTLVYIILGAVGVPVFTGFKGGVGVLLGATGGYIIGFIFTSLVVGLVSDKTKGKLLPLSLSMVLGVLLCYTFGTVWFILVYSRGGDAVTLSKTLSLCVTPFLLPDAVKIAVASLLTNKLRRFVKQSD